MHKPIPKLGYTEQSADAVWSSRLTLEGAHASDFGGKRIHFVAGAGSLADAAMRSAACQPHICTASQVYDNEFFCF